MFRKTMAAAAVATVALAHPALAASNTGAFAVRGVGAQSCAAVTKALGQGSKADKAREIDLLQAWVGGYLSFANRAYGNTFDVSPLAANRDVVSVAAHSCESAPGKSFEAVTFAVIRALYRYRIPQKSGIAAARGSIVLRKSAIVVVQKKLIGLGLLKGTADGVLGPQTVSAVRKFKASEHLKAGGALDLDTYLRLLSR